MPSPQQGSMLRFIISRFSNTCFDLIKNCLVETILSFFSKYDHISKSKKGKIFFFVQKSCITYVVQTKPAEVYVPESQTGVRFHIWRLVTSPPFENFIMLLIILNTILLMCKVNETRKIVKIFFNTFYVKARISKLV